MNADIGVTIAKAREHSIGDLLRRSAAREPSKLALSCGAVRWTFAELDAICNRLARGLPGLGVGKGDRLAVLSRNSHAFAALRFAVARIGAVLVPINFMLNPDEINFILKSSGARLLATGPDFVEAARAASSKGCAVEKLIWLPGEDPAAQPAGLTSFDDLLDADSSLFEASVDSRDLAQIVYTSGTESLPKGAMLSHEAVMWQYVSCIIDGGMSADDKVLHALPLYHCAQLDVFLGPQVYLGASGVITGKPTADNILALIQAHGITCFFAPPTIWIAMLRSPNFDKSDLSSLQKGYYGASIMPVEVLLELQRRLPNVKFWNFYGQTEIAPLATVLTPEDQLRKAGSAGKPAINVETRVVNTAMEDVGVGEIGEIVHRSPHLLSGYYNDPVKTAAAFAGGWFHSGDLATVDAEGYITVVDRVKDMIKSGGENVASREVEEMIYKIPAISEVAVVGLPDPHWIEAVTAIVVVKSGEKLDEDAVITHCAGSMAHFKVPKRVIFVDSLPKNPSGKLLKRELRQRFIGGETLDKAIQKNFGA
ncbi:MULTISPECIES: acyl-CoA synthetase [Bradyrhizobium]|uniref:3-methylmercaptopropionyl-CoA ligase n=3 Tax=Bradyrhizobium TaxID=374 RepID=A0A410VIE7_9BRAD|nr:MULTISPECIES: acyl-CoA synthetase [Bradyrhizobium]MCG2628208.1 acyl-CoA synthetase [Bradyrhizobium zhengyangense]MCG2643327.1 acyl-CoA synthetase [Bradyrhizobium zhengyangense]MCG2670359.1 acyl-CoA synthetase [Bradyrhizobium zhengyangense]MDN4985906.1 acyl-CoA synthetase [Bradyrhizobium sp. WYCCWR 13022]MDN5002715.1 acyl-CoA synthetase [Bradyrhizobium sp. WYCCWR 12677]